MGSLEIKEKVAQSTVIDKATANCNLTNNSIPKNNSNINTNFCKSTVKLINMNDVEPAQVEWLWYPYIPLGKLSILQGDPGCGKTTFILALAALLTNGADFPTPAEKKDPMNIIYQTAEDGLADTIKPRLLSYGADCSRINVIDDSDNPLTLDDKRIEEAIIATSSKLFVIDPLQAFLGAKIDMHRANEVRPILSKIGAVAERTGCAIVIIGHMNKGGGKGLYRSLGTIDIVAAARSVLLLGKDPNDSDIRAVVPIKASLAPEGIAVSFSVGEDGFSWIGECDLTATDLLSEVSVGENRIIEQAGALLLEYCKGKLFSSVELEEIARENGVSKSTLKRAKARLGAKSSWKGNQWFVTIP
jgi:DNA repair protein RadA/Sms